MIWAYAFFTLFFGVGMLTSPIGRRIRHILSTIIVTMSVPISILVILSYYCSKSGIPLSREILLFTYGVLFCSLLFKRLKTDTLKDVLPQLGILLLVSLLFVLVFSNIRILPTGYGVDTARHLALSEYVYENQEYPQEDWTFIHSQYYLYPMGTASVTGVFSSFLEVDPAHMLYPFMLFICGMIIVNIFWILHQLHVPAYGFLLCGILLSLSELFYSVSILSFYAQIFGLFLLTSFIAFFMQEKNVIALIVVETALVMSYPLYAFLPFFAFIICKDLKKVGVFYVGTFLLSLPFAVEHIQNPIWLVPTPPLSFSSIWKEIFFLGLALILAVYGMNMLHQSKKGHILLFFLGLWIAQIPVFFVLDFLEYVDLYFLYKQVFILLILLPIFLTFSVLNLFQTLKSLCEVSKTRKKGLTFLAVLFFAAIFCLATLNLAHEVSVLKRIPLPLTEEEYTLAVDLRSLEDVACTNHALHGFSHERHVHILMLSAVSQTYFDVLPFQEFLSSAETGKYHYLIAEKEDYERYKNSFSQYHIRKEGTYTCLLETTSSNSRNFPFVTVVPFGVFGTA